MDFSQIIPTFGNVGVTILALVVALSIIVAIHEYGHYIVGRWTGIYAEVFSIGFGPVLFSREDRRGTKWQIAALPLGGYVRFLGDANAASAGVHPGVARQCRTPSALANAFSNLETIEPAPVKPLSRTS